ncbi:MAG: MgtC/SapB family protein [Acidaminococcaceae bacterium]|nr:MgtC/SapB family protein [Acidaminococcaceae bacterium]
MLNAMDWQMIMRLCLAALLGGIVGMERGSGDRPAGLRTHVLVCTGSALIMLVSIYAFDPQTYTRDPGRIAAQVVSGIGFLGAGTILHEGLTVRGLTTAASLWMVAAIGLAIGSGMILVGIISTVIMLITLVTFHGWEKRLPGAGNNARRYIRVVAKNNPDTMMTILGYLGNHNVKVRTLNVKNNNVQGTIIIELYLKISKDFNINEIIAGINTLDDVISLENVV